MPRFRLGCDIGGTFTDLVLLLEEEGRLVLHKTPTTPEDPSHGLARGLLEICALAGVRPEEGSLLLHGTTIATNAVLEGRFPRGVLITTEGFRDVLEIGRHARRDLYGLDAAPLPPLIPRPLRLEVRERIGAGGEVVIPLEESALGDLAARLVALAPETVAVSLLNAHVNPLHEQRIVAFLRERLPHLPVSCGSEINPEIREFERTASTVLNALLMPVVAGYLDRLESRLAACGWRAPVLLVQSNGGVCRPQTARREPLRLLLSGPSGGAAAARRFAARHRLPHLLACDLGGTSFDVSLVIDGAVAVTPTGEIAGRPVRTPMVEIHTIGAGGGSIARLAKGRLQVGPESAGAVPGPIAYGRGGTSPTVTDADLLLGRLDPGAELAGGLRLERERTRQIFARELASPLGLGVEEAARGVLTLLHTAMAHALRRALFSRGLDPRDFALLAFGGAGGLHAIEVAEEVGISRVYFPEAAEVFSAYGLLGLDLTHELAENGGFLLEEAALPRLAGQYAALLARARARLEADEIPDSARHFRLSLDLRYRGQAFELTVPAPEGPPQAGAWLSALREAFDAEHLRRYGHAHPGAVVEVVTVRLAAIGTLPPFRHPEAPPSPSAAPLRLVPLYEGGEWRDVPLRSRSALPAEIEGPALIVEPLTTLYLKSGWHLSRLADGSLLAKRGEA